MNCYNISNRVIIYNSWVDFVYLESFVIIYIYFIICKINVNQLIYVDIGYLFFYVVVVLYFNRCNIKNFKFDIVIVN